ncbi:MAG: Holliday junction branch migration protein RuvA [Clostridia bacterium]|nr:Holliday junction branch migration protein RuvA [Clostridia bacterium]
MYYSLRGKLIHQEPGMAVIECGGVGYKCFVSMNTLRRLPQIGGDTFVYTHLSVREDAMDLYGFISQEELNTYKMLTGISGVGPKVGLAILSELTPADVAMAAASGDAKAFSRANGVGPKLAGRIVLELKDKVNGLLGSVSAEESKPIINNTSSNAAAAVQALAALGYSTTEAAQVIGKLDSSLKTEDLIRQALIKLNKF